MNLIFRLAFLKRAVFALSSHFIWLCIVIFLMFAKNKNQWFMNMRACDSIEPQNALYECAVAYSMWYGIFSHGQR